MNPASANAAELIATLCIAAPLTFAGLLVAIDPVKFLKLVNTFSDGLQGFRDHLHSSPWEDPRFGPGFAGPGSPSRDRRLTCLEDQAAGFEEEVNYETS